MRGELGALLMVGSAAEARGGSATIFFIAAESRTLGLDQAARQIVEATGFELFQTIDLNEKKSVGYQVNDAPPMSMLVAFDVLPAPVKNPARKRFCGLDNGRVLEVERRSREFIESQLPANRRFELVRGTRNDQEAWQAIRQVAPATEEALRKTITQRMSAMKSEFEVVRDLTRMGARSKIELIRYGDRLAVKKTYRQNCLRFLEREANFMETFAPERREVPPLLERGPNYLIMPFVEGRPLRRFFFNRSLPKLMTLKQVRATADFLRYVFSRGYDPVDLGPHNLLIGHGGRITAIDFEFAHRSQAPVVPERSACLAGVREGFEGEWPSKARFAPKRAKCVDPWRLRWFACTGLSVDSFLYDPPWLQWLKRPLNYSTHLARKASQRVSRRLSRRLPAIFGLWLVAAHFAGTDLFGLFWFDAMAFGDDFSVLQHPRRWTLRT